MKYQYVLFPGRHHILTNFQHEYLSRIFTDTALTDLQGRSATWHEAPAIIWAVTSADHANTRRNPLPANRREAAIERFAADLLAESFTYQIEDIGASPRFADHTLKAIEVQSRGRHYLTPENTIVACSTPAVIELYEQLGFAILPAELVDRSTGAGSHPRPWDVVTAIAAAGTQWRNDPFYQQHAHPASRYILEKYRLGDLIVELHSDPLLGDEGDITDTRDYETYRLAFDEGATRKYGLVRDYIVPGRIVDIGCATGAIMKLMSHDERLREADLYGIEVARRLYRHCLQRLENGEFGNENTFFYQRNIMSGALFPDNSVQTTTTFSLTHEIESYIGHEGLLKFIDQIYRHTAPNGVFINLDVVGPDNKDELVLMKLNHKDGQPDDGRVFTSDQRSVYTPYLDSLSTEGRFQRFARDFRHEEGDGLQFEAVEVGGEPYIKLRMADASDFLATKDYTDSWFSEMHERFCFWSFADWQQALSQAGFQLHPNSHAFRNDWIAKQRWHGKAELFRDNESELAPIDFPVTTVLLVAQKVL